MEETIDLREYFKIIKEKLWLILTITIIMSLIAVAVNSFVLKPVYQASTTLIVNTSQDEEDVVTGDQINVTQKLAVTYGEIIKSRTVLQSVIDNINLDITYEDLVQKVSVSPVNDTQIIKVNVEYTDSKIAQSITNEIPKVFTKEVKRITQANNVQIIDKAVQPEEPIKPNKTMNVLIAAVLGIMIGLFITFLIEYMNNKIKSAQDIERYLELTVLGAIPNEK